MDILHEIIGKDQDITWWQMVVRGTLVFFVTLALIRVGGKRIFGKNTSFDIVLGVILGSIMSRAITGNSPFLPTIAAATALVLLHWLLAEAARRSRRFGRMIKGSEVKLIEDGRVLEDAMAKTNITPNDLLEALRLRAGIASIEDVEAAYLERSGDVSVIR